MTYTPSVYLGLHLLWKIGNAHSDINFSNMISYGYGNNGKPMGALDNLGSVLIAATRSCHRKTRKSSERTGTIPFMALDLLDFPGYTRRFRHDFESAIWCLAWQTVETKPKSWFRGPLESASRARGDFLEDYFTFRVQWRSDSRFLKWCLYDLHRLRQDRIRLVRGLRDDKARLDRRMQEDDKAMDKSFVKLGIEAAKSFAGGLEVPWWVE